MVLFWFRRDLRLKDNTALFHALSNEKPGSVQAIFILDTNILDELPKNDQRIQFILKELQGIDHKLKESGSSLDIHYGNPLEIFKRILDDNNIAAIYTNEDYEPYAIDRDLEIKEHLEKLNIPLYIYKDHVIFHKNDIVKKDEKPYTVFTPYMRKWKKKVIEEKIISYNSEALLSRLKKNTSVFKIPEEFQLINIKTQYPSREINIDLIKNYDLTRDIPSINGTSRLSLHFRFGTTSIRYAVIKALEINNQWLNEFIWREFYQMIIWHFPKSATHNFKAGYNNISWDNKPDYFKRWKEGTTGFPMVDAGMRELNATGFMHNRLRMITASFLCKHLLTDWRFGEAYFAEKLLDYDLASNVGGWQWAASTGCDAVPYFRIFNPESQQKKFDPNFKYIKKWIPEFGTSSYPEPIIDHKFARERAISVYKRALHSIK